MIRSMGIFRPLVSSPRLGSNVWSRVMRRTWSSGDDTSSDFYRYTSGRWLFEEEQQLEARHVRFNVDSLVAIAARCIGHEPASCVKVEKLLEGDFNKCLLLTMEDGSQVVARVPNPNAGRPHYTTASEVATMDFARNKVGLPVPKVLAWSSRASENPVGAEYVIMEKAPGTPLSEVWPLISDSEKSDIVRSFVNLDIKLLSHPLRGIGALYYPNDIPSTAQIPALPPKDYDDRWVLGPTNDQLFFLRGKGELTLDRGPWNTTQEYLVAVCQREMKAIQDTRRPLRPIGIVGPGGYQPDRALKLSVCREFLKVVDHILPPANCQIPVLWHPDLHLDNIFVNPEKPSEITGLIGWQSAKVGPLFNQVSYPTFLRRLENLRAIHLSPGSKDLQAEAQRKSNELLLEKTMYRCYDTYSVYPNSPVFDSLSYRDTLCGQIIILIDIILYDGELAVQGLLIELADTWGEHIENKGDFPRPLKYSATDIERHQELELRWTEGILLMNDLLESLGGLDPGWEGWAKHEDYGPLKERLALVREQFVEYQAGGDKEAAKAWEAAWPFRGDYYQGPGN
ncbi:Phosphotransferase enzyme [Myotisia sp. PD_48]|nr:Phosphotransferase enzyme [Myotisia sp. PD_48]